MKKIHKLTTAVLLSALAAGAAEAATVYQDENTSFEIFGRIQALLLSKHGSQPDRVYATSGNDNTIASTARLGLAGRSKITDGLDAVMMAEWDMADGTLTEHTRYLFAGIDAYNFGTLLFGRGDSAFYTVAGATDIYNYLDNRSNDYYAMGDTLPGQVMYRLSALGFDLRLSYQTASTGINGTPFSVRNAAAASLSSQIFRDFTLAYGISYSDLTYKDSSSRAAMGDYFTQLFSKDRGISEEEALAYFNGHKPGHKYDYGVALSYGYLGSGLYGAFVFTGTDYEYLKHQLYTYELALNYSFDNGIGINGGVELQHYHDFFVTADLKIGVYYQPIPSFKVFAESQLDLGAEPERFYGSALPYGFGEDKFVLGAEFDF